MKLFESKNGLFFMILFILVLAVFGYLSKGIWMPAVTGYLFWTIFIFVFLIAAFMIMVFVRKQGIRVSSIAIIIMVTVIFSSVWTYQSLPEDSDSLSRKTLECEYMAGLFTMFTRESSFTFETKAQKAKRVITERMDRKSACYAKYMVKSRNLSICNSITVDDDPAVYGTCYGTYAAITEDSSVCRDIGNISGYFENYIEAACFSQYALNNQDMNLCADAEDYDTEVMLKCYILYAINTGDADACLNINVTDSPVDNSYRNACYENIGNWNYIRFK